MRLHIQKLVRYVDETYIEGGKPAQRPWVMGGVVTANPWAGKGFVEDLRTDIISFGTAAGRKKGAGFAEIGGANIVKA